MGLATTVDQYEKNLRATQGDGQLKYLLLEKEPAGQLKRPREVADLDRFVDYLTAHKVKAFKRILLAQAARKYGQAVADGVAQGKRLVGASLVDRQEVSA